MAAATNRWLVLVAMTGALAMIMLDQTVVAVALPVMSRELPLTPTGQQWVANAYVLAMAVLVAFGGRVGDLLGGVRTFRLGVLVFLVASAACGLAPAGPLGEPLIIAGRAVQGAGAALMVPVSAAIVISAFDAGARGRAMAIYVGISQVFLAAGPLLGGLLTEVWSWRAVFWLNVPVGVGALVLVHLARPVEVRRGGRIRLVPLLLLVVGLGASVLAVQQASRWSWTSPLTLGLLGVGLVAVAVFVRGQLRDPDPLVDVGLLRRRAFLADVAIASLLQFGLIAVVLFGSLYLQDLLGLGPLRTGLALLALILPLAIGAQVAGRWYDRRGLRPPVVTGLAIAVAGLVLWAAALPALSYPVQLPGMILTGLGVGLVMSPTNTDALSRIEAERRAPASGLVQTMRQLGGTLGVAVVGAVVLGIEREGTRATAVDQAAAATTAGFAVSATAVLVALGVALWLVPGDRPIKAQASASPGPVPLPHR